MVHITQETFDQAVEENIETFGLSADEALEETIKQFETQGVDLSDISKDLMSSRLQKTKIVIEAVAKLKNLKTAKSKKTEAEFLEQLQIIKRECDKGLQFRVSAGKEGAYNLLLETMLMREDSPDIKRECLKCLISLQTQQPDLLDERGMKTMMAYLKNNEDHEMQRLVLKWMKECCILSENNRQMIFDAGILDEIKMLLDYPSSAMLRDIMGVLRALILDDDVRVEFGRSHEHARAIASNTLCSITELLTKYKDDEPLLSDLILTLSCLIVTNEFCKKVEDAGALDFIKIAMTDFRDNEKLMRQCMKLLKVLSGNDDCKAHIIQIGLAPLIAEAINESKKTPQTAIAGLGCVAALSLRSPENSNALFTSGLPAIIIECMKLHPDNMNVQRNASWAIRNMVSRSRHQVQHFLKLGAEGILNKDLKKFPQCEYDIKAALRDLNCKVDFKEEWTGKGGMITTQEKK